VKGYLVPCACGATGANCLSQHKRLRENIWQIPAPQFNAEDPEFEKAWEEASDLNSDDFEIMREENEILASSIV
jgi:CTD kinase subunit gamma